MRSPGTAFDLRAALRAELESAANAMSGPRVGAKAVRRCRVRLKRAQALARVGRVCAPGLSAVFADSARGLMRLLAQFREPAAMAEAARATAQDAGKKTAAALIEAAVRLEAERRAADPLDADGAIARIEDLIALAQVWPEPSPRQVRTGARRLKRRARRARRRALGGRDAKRRQEWRNCEKQRLFAAEALGRDWPGRRRRKAGAQLSDLLGRERDALLLARRLEAEPELAGGAPAAARAITALNRRAAKLARRADRIGAEMRGG